ncbi:MAG: hypothetical protein HF311_18810, partial [Ignavibacteria bacterium]|nr:hypothetical protein [Ignavibacteria bacterium]
MKRLYLCATVMILCFIAISGYARAQTETMHSKILSGRVFDDLNRNGINENEPGIGGITVNLHKCPDGPVISTTTTSYENGSYCFNYDSNWDLYATYYIEFVLPDQSKTFTSCNQGNDEKDSDADPATGKTDCYAFQGSERSIDAGLIPADFIGNFVWFDANGDGIQNEKNAGIEHIKVELYVYVSENEKHFLRATETDNNGNYKFSHMEAGTYSLRFIIPDGMKNQYEFTPVYGNLNEPSNSDAGEEGWTMPFTLTWDHLFNLNIDAGLKAKTYHGTGCIGDFVWLDKNGNGFQDYNEPGIQGIRVELYSCQWDHSMHTLLDNTVTDANGYFSFNDLNPGTYCLKFCIPNDYQFTVMAGSPNDADNSDAGLDGSTNPITLADGYMSNKSIDAGLMLKTPPATGCIGDFVWLDANQDGYQYGEPGMANLTVCLYNSDGTLKSTTTTDANGYYNFANLESGRYYLRFTLPSGYAFTKNEGSLYDGNNSDVILQNDGKTASFNLAAGEKNQNIDAGLVPEAPPQTGCIGDFVWLDNNANGLQDPGEPGIRGVRVEIYSCQWDHSSHTLLGYTVTDDYGYYSFNSLKAGTYCLKFFTVDDLEFTTLTGGLNDGNNSDAEYDGSTKTITLYDGYMANRYIDAGLRKKTPPATGCIGDFVWFDSNGNGYQETGEPGIKGVRVELYACQWDHSSHVFQSYTTTDDNGYYSFTGLKAGTYCVKFYAFDGYKFTVMTGSLNDGNNSDADNEGWAKSVTLADGYMTNRYIDAGMVIKEIKKGSIGDLVWRDKDEDGIQDDGSNEPGLPNVMVELYQAGSNTLIQTDITDMKGKYLFENLMSGSYYVKFILPEGFKFTKMNQDGVNLDSDADPATGKTAEFYLGNGDYKMSVDAGMYGSDCMPAAIGNFVWNDLNVNGIQNSNEPGMANITVNLYKCGQTTIYTTTRTDGNGFYQFAGLLPGNYYLQFVLPSGEFAYTYIHQGSDKAMDSDAGMTNGITDGFELSSGEIETTVDAGMFKGQCLLSTLGDMVWIDG